MKKFILGLLSLSIFGRSEIKNPMKDTRGGAKLFITHPASLKDKIGA